MLKKIISEQDDPKLRLHAEQGLKRYRTVGN